MLEKRFLRSDAWRKQVPDMRQTRSFGQIFPDREMQFAGLVCCGGRTPSVFYQMWFTEQHPTICSTGPTRKWLEHAICLLSHDYSNADWFFTRNSQYVLREYATHSIRDYIRDELDKKFGLDSRIEVYPILDAVLAISKTREEGAGLGEPLFSSIPR